MPATKQRPCCARLEGNIVRERSELARLARKRSRGDLTARRARALDAQIDHQRELVQQVRDRLVDHEAEHCAEVAL